MHVVQDGNVDAADGLAAPPKHRHHRPQPCGPGQAVEEDAETFDCGCRVAVFRDNGVGQVQEVHEVSDFLLAEPEVELTERVALAVEVEAPPGYGESTARLALLLTL